MGARWYQPGTGTFTSRDSIIPSGDSILANRYTYGAGAPLDFDDPDGHWPRWMKRAASAAVNITSNVVEQGVPIQQLRAHRRPLRVVRHQGGRPSDLPAPRSGSARSTMSAVRYVGSETQFGLNQVARGADWAKQQAKMVAQRIYQAKVAVTAAAKSAIKQAVKFAPS